MSAETQRGSAERLVEAAREAREAAYAPYSGYRVGAALEANDGRVFTGCNVENASYPVGICAERAALGAAVRQGARQFRRVVVATGDSEPASPCGMCRQALAEFGGDLEVIAVSGSGRHRSWALRELLPDAFGMDVEGPEAGG